MKPRQWEFTFGIFLGSILGTMIFTVISPALSPILCESPLVKKAISEGEFGWCAEFWLNRYQSLLGTLVAIVAAWLAWRAVNKQIAVADKTLVATQRPWIKVDVLIGGP